MNYEQYQNFVLSRAKPGADILEELVGYQVHIWHMATGIVGEVVELMAYTDRKNMLEELGDIEFYLAGLLHAAGRDDFGWSPTDKFQAPHITAFNNELHCMHSMLKHSGDLLDYAKKLAIYQKKLDLQKFNDSVHGVRYALEWFYKEHKTSGGRVRSSNKKKLEIRYPDGYSNKSAQARADKQNES